MANIKIKDLTLIQDYSHTLNVPERHQIGTDIEVSGYLDKRTCLDPTAINYIGDDAFLQITGTELLTNSPISPFRNGCLYFQS